MKGRSGARRFGPRAPLVAPAVGWTAGGALGLQAVQSGSALLGVTAAAALAGAGVISTVQARRVRRLEGAEALYRGLVQEIPAILYVDAADETGSAIYISPKLEEYIGYSTADWYSSPDFFMEILHPDDRDRLEAEIAFNNAGNRNRSEYRVIAKNGDVVWFYDESIPECDASGRVVQTRGCMIDITDRKRAEAELRAAEDRYRQLVDELPVTVYVDSALDDSSLFVSPQIEDLLGFGSAAFIADSQLYSSLIHADDRDRVRTNAERNRAGDRSSIEYRLTTRDGREIWVLDEAFPEVDERGRTSCVRGFIIDITPFKSAALELAVKEDQLRQAQKMEAVGLLAGGIAHDFNNLLTVIRGNVSLLLEDHDGDDRCALESLQDIDGASERAAALTSQLLTLSRKQVWQPATLDLAEVVRDLERILLRTIGEDIRVRIYVGPGTATICADRTQMEQLVLNLAVNARDAMPDGGDLAIEVRVLEGDAAGDAHFGSGCGSVGLTVSDTGVGIPEEIRDRIFDPFFTTKAAGKGTGLGLSTVHGIVDQSGGAITVVAKPGGGTQFDVVFPRVDPLRTAVGSDPLGAVPRLTGTGVVLVVEDERALREIVVRTLQRSGFRVVGVESGASAIDVLRQDPERIDLLLTDVVMPDMGGRAVVDAALAIRPDLPYLYMSGYADDEIVRRGVATDSARLLEKPFTPDQLVAKVGSVMTPAPTSV